ncbi:MAG TPA: divalent-cation tolerance protein CutA [Bryobacteraceae bacterium]|jgi:periplasmic divalent cation tolerance protein
MTDALVVLCTCADERQALGIANALIETRAAACVTLLPAVQSVYHWQGKIEKTSEILLLIKTTEDRFRTVENKIVELHSYDTPEIIALPVIDGLQRYLTWLQS